jgi:hypothetical protein
MNTQSPITIESAPLDPRTLKALLDGDIIERTTLRSKGDSIDVRTYTRDGHQDDLWYVISVMYHGRHGAITTCFSQERARTLHSERVGALRVAGWP